MASIDIHSERDLSTLFARIGSIFQRAHLARAGDGDAPLPTPADVQALLDEGYAEALALEMEQARIEHRIADLFAAGTRNVEVSPVRELRALGARRLAREDEIIRLRSVLEELSAYGDSLVDGR